MRNKKRMYFTVGILITLFLVRSTLSQEAKIDIEHVGYGKTAREARFNIRNVGDVPITNIMIFVDGEYYRTVKGEYAPKKGFETILYLDPGEHIIEVRTNGASDSQTITISPVQEKPKIIPEEETTFFPDLGTTIFSQEGGIIWIGVGILILIVILVIVIWLLKRKPKLEMEVSQLP